MILSGETVAPHDVAQHYDDLDPFYRAIWGDHVHHGYWRSGKETPEAAVEALVDLLAARVGVRSGERICDIGCGYGAAAAHIADRFGCSVTGFTLSHRQAMHAQRRAEADPRLAFHCADWLENTLPAASFDRVVAIESTEHMADKGGALREMQRVLRPGGRLGICAWLAAEQASAWERRLLLEPICREGRLPSMVTERELRSLAVEAGFGEVAFIDISRSVRRTWSISARRLVGSVATDAALRRYLSDSAARNRVFALTLFRIAAAFRTGAMRYGILTATRMS